MRQKILIRSHELAVFNNVVDGFAHSGGLGTVDRQACRNAKSYQNIGLCEGGPPLRAPTTLLTSSKRLTSISSRNAMSSSDINSVHKDVSSTKKQTRSDSTPEYDHSGKSVKRQREEELLVRENKKFQFHLPVPPKPMKTRFKQAKKLPIYMRFPEKGQVQIPYFCGALWMRNQIGKFLLSDAKSMAESSSVADSMALQRTRNLAGYPEPIAGDIVVHGGPSRLHTPSTEYCEPRGGPNLHPFWAIVQFPNISSPIKIAEWRISLKENLSKATKFVLTNVGDCTAKDSSNHSDVPSLTCGQRLNWKQGFETYLASLMLPGSMKKIFKRANTFSARSWRVYLHQPHQDKSTPTLLNQNSLR
ncbi:hypothetical protein VP01_18g9 [Puccinia sorghi]|uniref:Uncharacterized protein n=1 Tax=Puccinia sorghi TaxID=27349 RepID=A0A0L6VCW2_9BASI|nr:hypothetical protein VP01_18g9 [Puccinia sorghi]